MSDEEFNPRRRRKGQNREKVSMDEFIRKKREAENIKVETGNANTPEVQRNLDSQMSDQDVNRPESDVSLPVGLVDSRQAMSETPPPLPFKRKESRPEKNYPSLRDKRTPDQQKQTNDQRRHSYYPPRKDSFAQPKQNHSQRRATFALPRQGSTSVRDSYDRKSAIEERKSEMADRQSITSEKSASMSKFENDWQEDKSLAETNEYMFLHEIGCDVTFLVGPNEEVIPAHSYVLMSRSARFYKLLSSQFNQPSKVVPVTDASPESFRNFLRFIYTDQFEFTAQESMALLPTADKYGSKMLKQKCFKCLLADMSSENVCSILELAHEFEEQIVYDKCLHFILVNAVDTMNAHGFRNLCRDCVENIVDADDLHADEMSVFNGLVVWACSECSRRKLQPNDKNRRDVLGKLLYCVRYCTMGVHDFTHKLSQNETLSAEEKIVLYQFFHGKIQKLPSHLQKRSRRLRATRAVSRSHQMSCDSQIYDTNESTAAYRSTSFMKEPKEQLRVLRFNGVTGTWKNNGPDAITFRCSEPIVLLGIQIFGPPYGVEIYNVNVVIFDDCKNVVRHQDVTITTDHSKYYDVILNDPIMVPAWKSFTVQTVIHGSPSIRGTDGVRFVSTEGIEFEFIATGKSLNGTDETTGQIPAILFSKT